MIASLEMQLKDSKKEATSLLQSLETREDAYMALKREYDGLSQHLKQASSKPTEDLIELMAGSDDDDEDAEVDKKKRTLPCMPMKKEGNWGPFPEAQWRAMLIVAVQMQQQVGGSHPIRRVVIHPAVCVDASHDGHFVVPFIMWDPVKLFGVRSPMCPACNLCAMRPCGWSKDGPRIAYTLHGVVLVLAKQFRCGNGRSSGCGAAAYATEDRVLKMFPPSVTTMFPFLAGKKRFVDARLASQWVYRYTSSNSSYTHIADEYAATLAEDFYLRCTAFFQRQAKWSIWSPNRKGSPFDASQSTLESSGTARAGAGLVMALLQNEALPDVFQGPSHDTVRHFIDKAAERLAHLQDSAMAAQTTEDTMKGDHTFKLAALCHNALGTPFTAIHTVMGDKAILLSVIFAKDESIAALREQHEELKSRHLCRSMPPPLIYGVDKCCSFQQLSAQLRYTDDEVQGLVSAAEVNGETVQAVAALKVRRTASKI